MNVKIKETLQKISIMVVLMLVIRSNTTDNVIIHDSIDLMSN